MANSTPGGMSTVTSALTGTPAAMKARWSAAPGTECTLRTRIHRPRGAVASRISPSVTFQPANWIALASSAAYSPGSGSAPVNKICNAVPDNGNNAARSFSCCSVVNNLHSSWASIRRARSIASTRLDSALVAVSVADTILFSNESASWRAPRASCIDPSASCFAALAEDTADDAARADSLADRLASPACVVASIACWRTKSNRELFKVLRFAFALDDKIPTPSSPAMPRTTKTMLAISPQSTRVDGLSGGLTIPLSHVSLSSLYSCITKYTSSATPTITANDEIQSHFSRLSTYRSTPDIRDSRIASALSRAEMSMARYQRAQRGCFIAISTLFAFVVIFGMGNVLYYWSQDRHIENHAAHSVRSSASHAATKSDTSHSRSVTPAAIAGVVRRVR